MAKFAYPGFTLAGAVSNKSGVELDGPVEVGDVDCKLQSGHGAILEVDAVR